MNRRIPCAVLGAGGYIGQHFVRLLAEHPEFELTWLGGGERSSGRALSDLWQLEEAPPPAFAGAVLRPTTPARLAKAGVELVFGGLPSGVAGPIETECVRRGLAVFSNAADHRMDPRVPLLVPEVNPGHLALLDGRRAGVGPLVTNANCSTTGLVLGLAPVLPLLRPTRLHVATYQALSGAGYPGVASLSIADNVVPHISHEEEKLETETRRILGTLRGGRVRDRSLSVLAHCARVGVREGHLEAVTIEASRSPSLVELERAWKQFDPLAKAGLPTAPHPPVELRREADRPQPVRDRWAGSSTRSRGMAAVVGRVRWEPPFLRLFLLSHNAVRGGAGGSVLNAELALARGYLGHGRAGGAR
ncbi:MAG: aspartate-semialdehyde dehydrogenase [Thermoplasmata archaeon]|nr:aspartate-semialdehyde dehydrogenase [Thermoplasmata archaeon]